MQQEDWQQQARCRSEKKNQASFFFPDDHNDDQAWKAAKKFCLGCPVREKCLQHAIDNNERFGVWGGLTFAERKNYIVLGEYKPARTTVEPAHGTMQMARKERRNGILMCKKCRLVYNANVAERKRIR
jgi:WhiB family redox-sensing transcriptional regulator